MTDSVEWLRTFLAHYPALQYVVIFLGAAFGGEAAIITLSFLAAQKFFPLLPFFLVSYVGTLSSDALWFAMGRTKLAAKITDHRHVSKTVFMIMEAIRKVSRGSHLLAIIFTKFLIGTRVVLILYVSKTNITLRDFMRYDLIAILIWIVVVIPIGLLAGLGYNYISKTLENIYAGIGFALFILIVFVLLQIYLKKFFANEGEEILEEKNL